MLGSCTLHQGCQGRKKEYRFLKSHKAHWEKVLHRKTGKRSQMQKKIAKSNSENPWEILCKENL